MRLLSTVEFFHRNWGWILVRGIVAILFGIAAILVPGATLTAIVLLLGGWFAVDGLLTALGAILHRKVDPSWVLLLIEGLIGLAAGVLALIYPGMTAVVLLYFFAGWSIATGVIEIVTGIRLRNTEGSWVLIVGGLLSIAIGVFAFISPGATALSLLTMLGIFAIAFGVAMVILAYRAKNWMPETLRAAS
jgi:uncharacterized membrane protein HdeD (DUF308 family)